MCRLGKSPKNLRFFVCHVVMNHHNLLIFLFLFLFFLGSLFLFTTGYSSEQLQVEVCEKVFRCRKIIKWTRLTEYQKISMQVEFGVPSGPNHPKQRALGQSEKKFVD
jgi:hypothetical protein